MSKKIEPETKQTKTKGMSYILARRLLMLGGFAILASIATLQFIRSVETIEVVAILLFIPIFVAFVLGGVRGGIVAAILAALIYTWLRYPAIEAIGADRFNSLIISRVLTYLAFGILGGWAAQQFEASLTKLDLYDLIDDETGLNNARFFLQDTDFEMSRCQRYQTIFSLCLVDIPSSSFKSMSRRKRSRVLRDLGASLKNSTRSVDHSIHARVNGDHRFAIVLPETAHDGAIIFTARLADALKGFLAESGVSVADNSVETRILTLPEDADPLHTVRAQFAAIDREQHPETAAAASE